jgi:hypothetical protein
MAKEGVEGLHGGRGFLVRKSSMSFSIPVVAEGEEEEGEERLSFVQ